LSLRTKLIKLAYENPDLRKKLLPILADDVQARYEEGKPADPTENMSEADKKEWWKQNEANKDNFKK
jgi:hypothetical protein